MRYTLNIRSTFKILLFSLFLFQITGVNAKTPTLRDAIPCTKCTTCPDGPYKSECESCHFSQEKVLTAFCKPHDKVSSLDTTYCAADSIANNNGVLTCTPPKTIDVCAEFALRQQSDAENRCPTACGKVKGATYQWNGQWACNPSDPKCDSRCVCGCDLK